MKFLSPLITCVALVCLPMPCSAQNYQPGLYITPGGDTLKGYTSVPASSGDHHFYFSHHPDSAGKMVGFNQCKELQSGEHDFIAWWGRRNMSYVDKFDQSVVNLDSGITERIPLRLVYKGKNTALYHFSDKTDHFFITVADTLQELLILYRPSTELDRRPFHYNKPMYTVNPVYQNQLMGLFGIDITERQMNWINNTAYNEASLKRFFKKWD